MESQLIFALIIIGWISTNLCLIFYRLGRLFGSKDKYEFILLSEYENDINDELKKLQDDGWVVAGNINSHYFDSVSITQSLIFIPLKRKIK